jgi:hypothetical protein
MVKKIFKEFMAFGLFYGVIMAIVFGIMDGFNLPRFIFNIIFMGVIMAATQYYLTKWTIKKLNIKDYNKVGDGNHYKMKISSPFDFQKIKDTIEHSVRYKLISDDDEQKILAAQTRFDGSSDVNIHVLEENELATILNIESKASKDFLSDNGVNYTNLLEIKQILNGEELIPKT